MGQASVFKRIYAYCKSEKMAITFVVIRIGGFAMGLATSRSVGLLSEVAVLSPIRKGRVPGERRTYEERARTLIATIENRVQQGIPHELDAVTTIHFGEIIVIRPEQYLVYSKVDGVAYKDPPDSEQPAPIDDLLYVAGQTAAARPRVPVLSSHDRVFRRRPAHLFQGHRGLHQYAVRSGLPELRGLSRAAARRISRVSGTGSGAIRCRSTSSGRAIRTCRRRASSSSRRSSAASTTFVARVRPANGRPRQGARRPVRRISARERGIRAELSQSRRRLRTAAGMTRRGGWRSRRC